MKDFKVLKFLDKISFIFNKLGIDYAAMRKILQLKLTMDERRVPTIMSNKKNAEEKNNFMGSLIIYSILGLFNAVIMFIPAPIFYKMNIAFGIIIFMVMSTMISDFSSELLDVKDKNILLPRPIDAKTINAAKMIHIFIYLFTITMAISLPTLIAGLVKYGVLFFIICFVELVLISGVVIFFTSLLYCGILMFFDGEKLKDVINYFQILLSIIMLVSYQFMGRLFEIVDVKINYTPSWWNYLIPSTWFSAPFALLIDHSYGWYYVIFTIMGVILPIVAFMSYTKVVVPYFERNLQKLNNSNGKNKLLERKERRKRNISMLACSNKLEATFFRFTQNMLSNERKQKLRLYPNFAFSVVMPFIFMLNNFERRKSLAQAFQNISSGKYYLFLYVSAVLLATSILCMSISEKYKGAWIYKALPIDSPKVIFKASIKAFILKYIVPVYVFESFIFIAIYGFRIVPDLILIFINMMILIMLIFITSKKELPFYKELQYTQDGNGLGVVLLSFLFAGLCAGAHFVVKSINYGILLNMLVSFTIFLILWWNSFKITWNKIKS